MHPEVSLYCRSNCGKKNSRVHARKHCKLLNVYRIFTGSLRSENEKSRKWLCKVFTLKSRFGNRVLVIAVLSVVCMCKMWRETWTCTWTRGCILRSSAVERSGLIFLTNRMLRYTFGYSCEWWELNVKIRYVSHTFLLHQSKI